MINRSQPSLYWELGDTGHTARDGEVTEGGDNEGIFENVHPDEAGPRKSDGFPKMPFENKCVAVDKTSAIRYDALTSMAGISRQNYSVQVWFLSALPLETAPVHNLFSRGHSTGDTRDAVGIGGSWNESPTGKLYFYEPVTGRVISGTATIHPDRWHQVVFVRDGENAKIYLDGQLDINAANAEWQSSDGEQFAVGNRTDYKTLDIPYGLTGFIDEVAVWNRSLDAREVKDLFALSGALPPTQATR